MSGWNVEENSECNMSGWKVGGRNSGCVMSGWNGGGEISDAICRVECWRRRVPNARCPDRMNVGRMEFWRVRHPGGMAGGGIPDAGGTSEWNGGGGILDAICPNEMDVVMSSMKVRYGLCGYAGLEEWF